MHRAETILQAIETTLTGLATTGTNVERSRTRSVRTLPAISIEMGADDYIVDRSSYPRRERDLNVSVISYVKNNTQADQQLNQIRAEVFAALMADRTLGQTFVLDVESDGDQEPTITGEGDQISATQEQNYIVKYRHSWTSTEA